MNAPIRQSDFIGDLCVALRHQWLPNELFVIFTGYFDEADTHGPSPTVIMAGFLGHAYQWQRFEKKLSRLQERDGFKVFHAKAFKAKAGEFSGWSDEKWARLIDDLTALVRDNLSEGIGIALERDRYLNEYRAPPIPRKMNLDSQYGVCFRACLQHMLNLMEKRNYRDLLNVVIEGGHKNVGDCVRIFDDLKSRMLRIGVNVLGSFTIEKKETCQPLMVGDMLASTYSMMRADAGGAAQPYSNVVPPSSEKEKMLTFLELRPDSLTNLKLGFERMRQREIEEWRKERATRKASFASSGRPPS